MRTPEPFIVYPLPTMIVCDRPDLRKFVSMVNKLQFITADRDYDLKIIELVEKIYDAGYNNGLKHMDKMHVSIDKTI